MKLRTVYIKAKDIQKVSNFWGQFFDSAPIKADSRWHEFMIDGKRFGILLDDFEDTYTGSNCVPVFEMEDRQILDSYVKKAKNLGASIVFDGTEDGDIQSIVLKDPFDNEFELTLHH